MALGAPLTNTEYVDLDMLRVGPLPQEQSVIPEVQRATLEDRSAGLAFIFEMKVKGVEGPDWFRPVIVEGLAKNSHLCWLLGAFEGNTRWHKDRSTPSPDDLWASLCLLPLEKPLIERFLRGELTLDDFRAENILPYEKGNVYSCLLLVTCLPGKEQNLAKLLEGALSDVALLGVEIEALYTFAKPPVGGGEKTPLFFLIESCFFFPLDLGVTEEDAKEAAWVLSLNREYQPSPAVRVYQGYIKYNQAIARLEERLTNDPGWQNLPELGEIPFGSIGDSE